MKKLLVLVALVFSFGAMAQTATLTSIDGVVFTVYQHSAKFDEYGVAIGSVHNSSINRVFTYMISGCAKREGYILSSGEPDYWNANGNRGRDGIARAICSGALDNAK
jgi:hypothetical protein